MTVISNRKNGYIISVKERLEEFIIRGSFPITQATWFIDNVLSTSDDTNDGLTLATALRTVNGFTSKTAYGKFMQPTEVFVSGDHTDESFEALYTAAEGANLAVRATSATTVATEAITTFVANAPTNTRTVDSVAAGASGSDFTTSAVHGFIVGQEVSHTGFTESTYNGVFTITSIVSTTVYEVAAITFAGTDTGTVTLTEASLITVTGFDWSSHVGRRIRFTSGAALDNVCFIAAASPNGRASDTVRVSRIGNTTDFNPSPTYTNPSDGDTFVIETLTPIGGIDVVILQGNPTSGLFLERSVQFSDFNTTPGTANTRITPHSNTMITRCIVGSELQGPGRLDMSLCHWAGVVAGFGGLNSVFRGCLITSSFASVFIQALEEISFIDSVFQGASFICRVRAANVDDCGFFDIPIAIQVNVNSSVVLRDAIFGSGITDVAIQIANAGGGSTFEILPTLTGSNGDTRIGGSVFAYGVLPTIPTLGAGLYPE